MRMPWDGLTSDQSEPGTRRLSQEFASSNQALHTSEQSEPGVA